MSLFNTLPFTAQERLIVLTLEQNESFVVSHDKLYALLYGGREEPNSNSMQVTIGRIRRKLADAVAAGAIEPAEIETIYGRGYRLIR